MLPFDCMYKTFISNLKTLILTITNHNDNGKLYTSACLVLKKYEPGISVEFVLFEPNKRFTLIYW